MADLRIAYDEEMVGAGHPTKEDTLNRLALAEHNHDGAHGDAARASMGALSEAEVIAKVGVLANYNGLVPVWASTTGIGVHGGGIVINSAPYWLTSGIAYGPGPNGTPSDNNWWFVTVTAPSGRSSLQSSDFGGSTTAPSFSEERGYWYIGTTATRVIGFCQTLAGYIQPFDFHGRWYIPRDMLWSAYSGSLTAGSYTLGLSMPNFQNFTKQVILHCYWLCPAQPAELRVFPVGAGMSDVHLLRTIWNQVAGQPVYGRRMVQTDNANQIGYATAVSGSQCGIAIQAIQKPPGM